MGRTLALHHRCFRIGKGLSPLTNATHVYPENEIQRTSETQPAAAKTVRSRNQSYSRWPISIDQHLDIPIEPTACPVIA